jgi:hypothetical protein
LPKLTHDNTKKIEVLSLEGFVDNDPQMSTVSQDSGHWTMAEWSETLAECHKFYGDGSARTRPVGSSPQLTFPATTRKGDGWTQQRPDVAANGNSEHMAALNLSIRKVINVNIL